MGLARSTGRSRPALLFLVWFFCTPFCIHLQVLPPSELHILITEILNRFDLVYLVDILIFSMTQEEHIQDMWSTPAPTGELICQREVKRSVIIRLQFPSKHRGKREPTDGSSEGFCHHHLSSTFFIRSDCFAPVCLGLSCSISALVNPTTFHARPRVSAFVFSQTCILL